MTEYKLYKVNINVETCFALNPAGNLEQQIYQLINTAKVDAGEILLGDSEDITVTPVTADNLPEGWTSHTIPWGAPNKPISYYVEEIVVINGKRYRLVPEE